MAPAARPAFKKGPGGTGPSIEAAGHLSGKTPGDLGAQSLCPPTRSRWRSCSCCCVGARSAPGPGLPQASLARGCRGAGQGDMATVLRPVVGCTCPARATGPCPRAPAAGRRGRAGALAVGSGPASTTRQHNKGPGGGGQGAQWPRPWPRVGVDMHRPRARGATLSLARALLVEGERPAAGVAGGGPRGRSIQPPGALMGPSMGPELGVYGGLTGLSMRSHWPHPTVVVCSEIGYYTV